LSTRTRLHVDGTLVYADATDLRPHRDRLDGAGVLAGRRYLASGVWYGVTLPDEAPAAVDGKDLVAVLMQSKPDVASLRALGSDAPSLETTLGGAAARIAAAWGHTPVSLARFRC